MAARAAAWHEDLQMAAVPVAMVTTAFELPGYTVTRNLGVVRATALLTIRSRAITPLSPPTGQISQGYSCLHERQTTATFGKMNFLWLPRDTFPLS